MLKLIYEIFCFFNKRLVTVEVTDLITASDR